MPATGSELRRRREALGLSLDDVAEATAIPVDFLAAVEAGELSALPPGPYAESYATSMRRYLDRVDRRGLVASDPDFLAPDRPLGPAPTAEGLDREEPAEAVVTTRPLPAEAGDARPPLRPIRVAAVLTTTLFAGLVGWQALQVVQGWQQRPEQGPAAPLEVRVKLRSNASLHVEVDGRLAADRLFAGGEDHTFRAEREVALDVPHLEAAWVWFEGRAIEPRGRQDQPRRLVFSRDTVRP